ncbi:MAG: hypothetical protein IIZ76_01835, partial [Clostridia bacterium]|nr:hypothetical protein [Clostridia bacterium]
DENDGHGHRYRAKQRCYHGSLLLDDIHDVFSLVFVSIAKDLEAELRFLDLAFCIITLLL